MNDIVRKQRNARMSQIVICNGIVWLSGQVPPSFLSGRKPVGEQTREVLARIDELLAEADTDRSRILSAQVLLADVADFDEMNAVWEAWIDVDHPPARTTCGAALAHPDVRVEITVTAVV